MDTFSGSVAFQIVAIFAAMFGALCCGLTVWLLVGQWLQRAGSRIWRDRLLRRVEGKDVLDGVAASGLRRRLLGRVELVTLLSGLRAGRWLLHLVDEAGLSARVEGLLQGAVAAAVAGVVVLTLLTSLAVAVVVLFAAALCLVFWLRSQADAQRQLLRTQIPDLLDGLARALRAGLSFPQAVSRVATDSPEPLVTSVRVLDADLSCGRGIAESFERFGQTAGLRELRMVSAAVSLMHRVGGNAPSMLEQTAGVIRQDLLLNRSLKAQTAQGRTSVRLVGSIPFVLVALMSVVLPDYLRSWLASGLGRAMFMMAVCLLLTGFLWVRKVVDVAV